jgi:hypothetical protein
MREGGEECVVVVEGATEHGLGGFDEVSRSLWVADGLSSAEQSRRREQGPAGDLVEFVGIGRLSGERALNLAPEAYGVADHFELRSRRGGGGEQAVAFDFCRHAAGEVERPLAGQDGVGC